MERRSDGGPAVVLDVGRRTYATAVTLAALAGFVDAMGFITLNGFFVSFMSGNTTRMGVAVVDGPWHAALEAAALIGLFVLGVVFGSLIGEWVGPWQRPTVMAVVAVLIAIAAVVPGPEQVVVTALVLAMGAENTVFDRIEGASISLTYMTGALVNLGKGIAAAVTGGPRWGWVRFAGMWGGLLAGVVGGTAVHRAVGLAGLWIAVVTAAALAVVFARESRPV